MSFNLAPDYSLGQATAEIDQPMRKLGMPQSVHGEPSGTLEAFQQSLSTEPYLVLTAILAVYLVLGILYESLVHPITILSTLPPASVGAILALMLTNSELDVMSITGIILLIGIVKKNAIMMIDFALNAERNEGKNTRDSIFEASLLRFRPILMTTMAALFGAVPLAIGTGMGSELAPATGHLDYRRADRQPGSHALHHPGDLPFHGHAASETLRQKDRARKHSRPSHRGGSRMKITAVILICVLLAGCTVGPKYNPPAVPPPPAFKEALPSAYNGALPGAWQPASPQDAELKGKWWEMFNEPELNALEEQLNIDNQNIAQFFQNFMAARALVNEARAACFPQ